jgi:FtsP/CotA-like multicopper oxidase with cupredoxin domain
MQIRPKRGLVALAAVLAAVAAVPAAAQAKTRDFWVAAVPDRWNAVQNGIDAIHGTHYDASDTVFPTVTYERFSRGWKRPMTTAADREAGTGRIPGPLLQAQVGDTIRVHFKNEDTARHQKHSMHFHGVDYRPGSDGAYIPGFSGRGAAVRVGGSFTYVLHAKGDSAGVWPYHDHSPSMEDSISGGMYGAMSIRGRRDQRPDREFVVMFAPMGQFQTIDGRAFVGNTPVFTSRVGDLVQWDVLAMGDAHHTFHVHGHRWETASGIPEDTRTLGPAESFRVRWREHAPGTWLYHCHVESHMMLGMIGLYRVRS